MDGNRNSSFQRSRPESVILWRWIVIAAGKITQNDAFQAKLCAALKLINRIRDISLGYDADTYQSFRRDRAVLFCQPFVIGADNYPVEFIVLDFAPYDRTGEHRREKHFSVNPIELLLLNPL